MKEEEEKIKQKEFQQNKELRFAHIQTELEKKRFEMDLKQQERLQKLEEKRLEKKRKTQELQEYHNKKIEEVA
jgi:hypothetical protein